MYFTEPKKAAIVLIYRMLLQETDETHRLTRRQIRDKLEKEQGIILDVKAIARSLNTLDELGFDVNKSSRGYYINGLFDDSELKVLVDAVFGAKYISEKYSIDLVDKLSSLTNKYFKTHKKHIHLVKDMSKSENKEVFSNISIIEEAIENKHKISFDFYKYNKNKKLALSSSHVVSPYSLIMHNQKYYLMGFNDSYGEISFQKVDRMKNMEIVKRSTAVPLITLPGYKNGMDYSRISSSMPYMYSDEPESIELLCDVSAIDQVIEWFGEKIIIMPVENDENKVRVIVKASVNAMEFWALQFGKSVTVVSPESLKNKVKNDIEKMLENYGGK